MNDENDIIISNSTMMLEPYKHPYYQTKIIESSGNHLYSCQTALQLIKQSCLTNVHSTYQGRRKAVQTNFHFKQNVPIQLIIENIFVLSQQSLLLLQTVYGYFITI